MHVSNEDYNVLKKISKEIDEFFKHSSLIPDVRSTDIYDFIKRRKPLKDTFLNGKEFNRFLRRMHKAGIFSQVIPNSEVDISNPNFYQWHFYRKDRKKTK